MADLLRKSGDSAREARDRVERAMRTSGGSEARVEPPPAPAPPVVPGASPLAVGGFVQAEEASGAHRPLPGPAPQRFAQPHAPVRAPLPPPPPVPANEEITKPSAASVAIEDDDDPPTGPSAGPAPVPVATTSPAQRAAAPAPVATPASRPTPPPPPALAAVVPASVPAAAPPPLPAAPPSPPAPKSPPIVAIRPAAPIPSPPAASMGLRAPIPLRPPGRGEAVAVRFSRAPGLRGHRRRLPGDTTLAEAAQQLVGQLVPLRVSADGRLLGWYRIGTEEGPLPVDHDVASLDDEANHPLHFVENRVAWFKVVAEGRAFQLAVGLAVPVASLVDALAVQLDLPDTSWLLELDGIGLDDFHILADHPTTPLSVLTLRRGPG